MDEITQLAQYNKWTDKEIETLKDWYQQPLKLVRLGELLPNRKYVDCKLKASKLRITGKKNKYYIYKVGFNLLDIEKAYMAGIFDGEGSLSITNRENHSSYWGLQIGMTNREVLELFQKKLDGHILKEKLEANRKQMYRYQLRNQNRIYFFLKEILPYLIVKREKSKEFIKYIENKYKIL